MFTRKINKNTATQLNTDKIGVLVHPDTYPPIVTVVGIRLNPFTYTLRSAEQNYYGQQGFDLREDTVGSSGVYYYTGVTNEVNGVTYYQFVRYWADIWEETENIWVEALWSSNSEPSATDPIYKIEGDTVTEVAYIYRAFTGTELGMMINESAYSLNDNGSYKIYNITFEDVEGEALEVPLVSDEDGTFCGFLSGEGESSDNKVFFVPGEEENEYVNTDYNMYVEEVKLYADSYPPVAGQTVNFMYDYSDYNTQTINEVFIETTPVPPDPVECTVSYSIDGETWTDVDTVLTDDNNVICNIPKYVYLKFSQDVEITEE